MVCSWVGVGFRDVFRLNWSCDKFIIGMWKFCGVYMGSIVSI